MHNDYVYEKGLLYKIISDEGKKLYTPKQCRLMIIRRVHEHNYCHVGWEKTLMKLKQYFWMPKMSRNVRKFIEHCIICLVAKRPSGFFVFQLHPIEKIPVPFHTVHVDCMGPFSKISNDYKYVLVIIDAFTKFIILKPLNTMHMVETVKAFMDFII